MGDDNTLELKLDAGTQALRAIYTPPDGAGHVPAALDSTADVAPMDSSHDAGEDDLPSPQVIDEHANLPSWESVLAAVHAQGWTPDALDERATMAFIALCRGATELVQADVGEVRDGSFTLETDAEGHAAHVNLSPPKGGRAVKMSTVLAAMADQGIVYGLQETQLVQALLDGRAVTVEVATGTPPTPGTPTQFESLLDRPESDLEEDIDELAPVDYRNLGSLHLVSPGTPLMRRTPPQPGTAGINVWGQPVPAVELADTPFANSLLGAEIDSEDPMLLRATMAGAPSVVLHGVRVNPVVEVSGVNLSTGNITFDGSLQVKGDVTATMEVRVTGDIVVDGTIEAAFVHAGGSITVNGGIIGITDNAQDTDASTARAAHVSCDGSLKARFIENAVINTGQNVDIEREIRQSNVASGGYVSVGPPGSHQGVITGGQTRALHAIRAGTIGAPSGIPTHVQAGLDPHADMKRSALGQKRQKLGEEKAKLEQLLIFLNMHPEKAAPGLNERARNTHTKICQDLSGLDEEEAQLAQLLQPIPDASVKASKRFCSGVRVQVGVKIQDFLEDQVGGTAAVEANQLVIR